MSDKLPKPPTSMPAPRIAEMEPWEARRILRGCDRSDQALLEVETAIETGRIYAAVGTIVYPNQPNAPMGRNARLRRSHWTRIISEKLRDDFWERGHVALEATQNDKAVELREIRLNGADVRNFAIGFDRNGAGRVDAHMIGHVPKIDLSRRVDKGADWDAFWLAVIKLACEGRLSRGYYHSQATLSSDIRALVGTRLSKNTIDPKVSLIWAKFIGPENP